MSAFVLLTKLNPGVVADRETFAGLEHAVMAQVHSECRGVEWIASFAVLGPYDYLDLFEAPDVETATKVALIVRLYGHAETEVWPATEWRRFKEIVHELPPFGPALPPP
ncbi:MAG: GYD domain-containing protein [Deltaproteobacteria bacterium]|nr:GYD domain-containing protein [Deltaproteobacteria bacterium]